MPLEGGASRPISETQLAEVAERVTPQLSEDKVFKIIQDDVLMGNHKEIQRHAQEMLDRGLNAQDILHRGLSSQWRAGPWYPLSCYHQSDRKAQDCQQL